MLEEPEAPLLVQLPLEDGLEAQCDVGILTGVDIDALGGEVAHALLIAPFLADELLDVYGAVAEIGLCQKIHVVPQLRLDDIVGDHGVKQRAADIHPVTREDYHVIFDVLSYLERTLIADERTELGSEPLHCSRVGGCRDVVGLSLPASEAHPDEPCGHRFDAGGLCVQTEKIFCQE